MLSQCSWTISSNHQYLELLLNHHSPDLIAISELWLQDYNIQKIQELHPDYRFLAECPPRQEHPLFCTPQLLRGHGGVAIGWNSRLDHLIKPTPIVSSHRMIGIEIQLYPVPVFVFSVYLPSRSGCTDESLDQLDTVLGPLPPLSDIIILGDFNADPGSQGGPLSTTRLNEQGRILVPFMVSWNLVSTHLHKSHLSSSHTFESEAHGTLSIYHRSRHVPGKAPSESELLPPPT